MMLTWERARERRLRMMRRAGLSVLVLILLMPFMVSPSWGEAAVEQRVLTLQTSSSKATVNGQSYVIAKPVVKEGAVMVPLGVFKQAFGSEIRLEGNNRIRLLHGPHNLVLVMDSKTAWIDGQKVQLPVAPTMVADTLMVPLRQVASGIGAKLSSSSPGNYTVSLTVNKKEPADMSGNEDSDKSRVGNSYYEWSINYSSWMISLRGDSGESSAYFIDPTDRYYLEVHATPQSVPLGVDDLLQKVISDVKDSGETILDRGAFPNAAVPYARAITRDMDGLLWETRAYYANNRVYVLYFSDANADHYSDLDTHSAFLNSFRPSFDKTDPSLKDLSTAVDGLVKAGNYEYGVYLNVPADWEMNNQDMLYGKEKEGYLAVTVTSVPKGAQSTMTAWVDRVQSWYAESFVQDAYKIIGQSTIEISGVKGQLLELQYNFGKGWVTVYQILIQHNGYRYHMEYAFPERSQTGEDLWEKLLESIEIDYDMVPDVFGNLGEDHTLNDKTKISAKISSSFRYHVDIPTYWTPVRDRFEQANVQYSFMGGSFDISVQKSNAADRIIHEMKRYYSEAGFSGGKVKLLGIENITFAGVPAVSFTTHEVRDGIGYTTREIVFENSGITYMIVSELNDASATDQQKAAIERTLASFEFITK